MIMENKMLKRWLIAGILIAVQGCAGATLNPFVEKPYFASPPSQISRADQELFDRALFRQTNNRIQPAIKVWQQFLEKYPRSYEARNNLGLVYFEDDQLDAAIIELDTAMSLEPSEMKIKKNLMRALKFKAILYKEARDYNRAVDTLKRAQEISTPEEKERIGYRIEKYEDKAFEQAKRVNTLEAYQAFLIRFPESSKNSDEARMKIEGLKHRADAVPEKQVEPDALTKAPPANVENEGMDADNVLLEGLTMEKGNKEDMEGEAPKVNDLTEKKMEPAVIGLKPPIGEDSGNEAMEKVEMADKTTPVVESLDNGFIPVQPLEVPRSDEQKIEIATHPEPKPPTGVTLFPAEIPEASPMKPKVSSPAPVISPPTQDDFPEVAQAPQKKVKIVTRQDPLRVRAEPTSDSRVLATVAKGSLVPLVKEENGWYKIKISDGEMGWVSKKYSQLVE
jgi:hypothetical protein